jgi:hypothetical protein
LSFDHVWKFLWTSSANHLSGFLACEQSNEVLTGIKQRFSNKFLIFFHQKFGKVFFFPCVNFTNFPVFWEEFDKFFISQIRRKKTKKLMQRRKVFHPALPLRHEYAS